MPNPSQKHNHFIYTYICICISMRYSVYNDIFFIQIADRRLTRNSRKDN